MLPCCNTEDIPQGAHLDVELGAEGRVVHVPAPHRQERHDALHRHRLRDVSSSVVVVAGQHVVGCAVAGSQAAGLVGEHRARMAWAAHYLEFRCCLGIWLCQLPAVTIDIHKEFLRAKGKAIADNGASGGALGLAVLRQAGQRQQIRLPASVHATFRKLRC